MKNESYLFAELDHNEKPSGTLILKEIMGHPLDKVYSATYNAEELRKMIMRVFPNMFRNK